MKFSTIVAFIAAPLVANAAAIEQISDLEARQATGLQTQPPALTNRAWISSALARVNKYRAQHAAVPYQWNAVQASYSATAANQCAMKHTGGKYSENIYWTSATALNFTQATNDAFDAWMSEQPLYHGPTGYDGNPNVATVPTDALHYTALMWKNSKRIGCGWSTACGNGGFYFFCEMDPQGNVLGSFGANVS